MLKISENNGTGEIGLVTPTPGHQSDIPIVGCNGGPVTTESIVRFDT